MNSSFENEIFELIKLKQEGEYWDFKREWYDGGDKKQDLLHDIICMANNLANRDAYIIIGVDDTNDYLPFEYDVKKRMTTQNLVDFLRDKHFAGDYRPVVTVSHVDKEKYSVDVIIIHNSLNTPFYLTQNFNKIRPYNIYTRVQDTNIPKDKSADISQVEKLWKKRFGLLSTPLERVCMYLSSPEDWNYCTDTDSRQYYKFAPEYTIELESDKDETNGYEYYMLNQTDITPHWSIIRIRYHQTIIEEQLGLLLDGGRYVTPKPQWDNFSLDGSTSNTVSYYYFIEGSLIYVINLFYYKLREENHETAISRKLLFERVLLFNCEQEREDFIRYAQGHWEDRNKYLERIEEPIIPNIPNYSAEELKKRTINVMILQEMLNDYRSFI